MNTGVDIGSLRHPIEFQKIKSDRDEYGFAKETYVTYHRARAKVEFDDRLMREVFREDGIDATGVSIFTVRYFPKISAKDIIKYKDEIYEIYGWNNINGDNRFYKIWGKSICQ